LRALIGLVVAGLVSTASAQPAEKIWRVGNVNGVSAAVAKPYEDAFLAGMRERGYVVGRNLVFDTRYADGDPSRYRALIDEVIALALIEESADAPINDETKTPPIWTTEPPPGLQAPVEQ